MAFSQRKFFTHLSAASKMAADGQGRYETSIAGKAHCSLCIEVRVSALLSLPKRVYNVNCMHTNPHGSTSLTTRKG